MINKDSKPLGISVDLRDLYPELKDAYDQGLQTGRQEFGIFAVTPMTIMTDKRLSQTSKLLYGIITGLGRGLKGYCFANNKYLGEALDVHQRSIRYALEELRDCALIEVFEDASGHRCIGTLYTPTTGGRNLPGSRKKPSGI